MAIIITSKRGTRIFFPITTYSKKTLRKNVPKSARKYKRNVLMPPEHPIILLKSNLFKMATVSVKRSIHPIFHSHWSPKYNPEQLPI